MGRLARLGDLNVGTTDESGGYLRNGYLLRLKLRRE